MSVVRWTGFLLLLLPLVWAQKSEGEEGAPRIYRQESEEIKLQEKKRSREIDIESTNFKSYNFKLTESTQFLLRPQQDQQVKIVLDTYWNQNNVYLQAAVVSGEQITLTVQDSNRITILEEAFYTSAGLAFTAQAANNYTITLQERGNYSKIVMMKVAEAVLPSNTTAKRDAMAGVLSKLLVTNIKLENGLKSMQTEMVVENWISKQILRQSENYGIFEMVEAVLIALAAWLEIQLVKNLLRNDSIV